MKPFKKILLIILSIPVLLLLVSLLLPSKYRVERTTVINAKPDAIFARINTPKQWPEWTAWTVAKYPDMKMTFSGPESGVGATYAWEGKSSGHGTLRLTRSEPDKLVGYDLEFEHGKYLSKGDFVLEPVGESVKVTWSNEGNLGWNPVSRYFGLLMDKMMGPDFEEGLRNLQKKAEAK
jgi:hypothetical protein